METYVLCFLKKGKNNEYGVWEDNGQKEAVDATGAYRGSACTVYCGNYYF